MYSVPKDHPSRNYQIGETVGKWRLLSTCFSSPKGRMYKCRCECGLEKEIGAATLFRGSSKSCGHPGSRGDGRSKERLSHIWSGMVQRCTNPKNEAFSSYGGRGILLCQEWRDYAVFREWAFLNGYDPKLQIDRRNNDRGYNPENCRWVTHSQNQLNTRANRILTAFGESKCAAEWVRDPRCKVCRNTLHYRLGTGWSHEGAIETPPISNRNSRRVFVRGSL